MGLIVIINTRWEEVVRRWRLALSPIGSRHFHHLSYGNLANESLSLTYLTLLFSICNRNRMSKIRHYHPPKSHKITYEKICFYFYKVT